MNWRTARETINDFKPLIAEKRAVLKAAQQAAANRTTQELVDEIVGNTSMRSSFSL